MSGLRVALIASARFPLRQPFAGGLEAQTCLLAQHLRRRGHDVTVFAGPGSDASLGVEEMPALPTISAAARADVSMPPDWFLAEHHAYLTLMLRLGEPDTPFDIVHNNSLHYLPVAMASSLHAPVLTTLHTPPTPWLESAVRARAESPVTFVAVSEYTAGQWRSLLPDARVIANGVDTAFWTAGPGGERPVWSGRIVPEKGPVPAIQAARLAGTGLRLAGPCPDPTWFDEAVAPLLGDGIDYVGHLDHPQLAELVRTASVAVVSPCWDEPYGLVVAEALACGTPVAAFERGAVPGLLDETCGVLAAPDDVPGLAAAIVAASRLDRGAARRRAEQLCSVTSMVDGYERLYAELAA
jgi:glycosyltransferase involved in cell wall biosynthesis